MGKALEAEIRKWLGEAYLFEPTLSFDEAYQSDFKDGDKKAQLVLDIFREEVPDASLRGSFIYISVGGADGQECEYALRNSELSKGIILEYSMDGAAAARKRAENLMYLDPPKQMMVFEGDATQKLKDALPYLHNMRIKEGLSGILVSCQGILHELPYRSHDFQMSTFFGQLFDQWENIVFVAKEPCAPDTWPTIVQLKIPSLPGKVLEGFAQHVAAHLKIDGKITAVTDEYVEMPSRLAGETLFKVLYYSGSERANYEMQESLTSFDPETYRTFLAKTLDPLSCNVVRSISKRLKERYRKLKVHVRPPESNMPLFTPNLHALVTASKIKTQQEMEANPNMKVNSCTGEKTENLFQSSHTVAYQHIESDELTAQKINLTNSDGNSMPARQKISIGKISGGEVTISNIKMSRN